MPPVEPDEALLLAKSGRVRPHLTLAQFRELEAVLRARGYDSMIEWSETIMPPTEARTFAREIIYVICNSGMNFITANGIYWRCVRALNRGRSSSTVFGHPGKTKAIDHVWRHRKILFAAFEIAENKLTYCGTLPFIGNVTKHHLAKNLGLDTIKPDVHLMRLANAEKVSPMALCARLAYQTGYRQSTIDSILWRACADRYLESSVYEMFGWGAATERLSEELKLIDVKFFGRNTIASCRAKP
ncbi:hypothetical protein [uncultured Sphingomonas sp.]|uniref:hypothetical protein n=1 Tax=uncultured Sphingomonas sp. TaxID=158754 RepID=UPI0025DBC1BF|nr:hypothetical protein [uncultured Sphingomonas sp.]